MPEVLADSDESRMYPLTIRLLRHRHVRLVAYRARRVLQRTILSQRHHQRPPSRSIPSPLVPMIPSPLVPMIPSPQDLMILLQNRIRLVLRPPTKLTTIHLPQTTLALRRKKILLGLSAAVMDRRVILSEDLSH